MTQSLIETIDLRQNKQPQCRIMICQLNSKEFDWYKKDGLSFLSYNDKIINKIVTFLHIAKQNSVDLILFPELSIPDKLIEKIQAWSREYGTIVICGSHYYKSLEGYVSRSPIIVGGNVFFTEKIKPSPLEKSPILGEGLNAGNKILKFNNTHFGNIAILICSDYLDEDLKKDLILDDVDILCVSAFQRDSEFYYRRMTVDCENSKDGIYILYSNFYDPEFGDGNSALFGTMDRIFSLKLKEKEYTNLDPDKKLFQFNQEIEYSIFDINLQNKRPFANRNILTEPNVRVVARSSVPFSKESDFLRKIAHDDDRYKRIDDYFVAPSEYSEILESLEKNNLVFIVGDPGIGKTYSAVKILKHYYEKGFEPFWFVGMEKEERSVQSKILSDFNPEDKQIIYFEDPFGRTVFERRDSLFQIFSPLLDKLSQFNSKIIITSRKEIFEQFSQESLLESDLLKLKRELNVRKPSYNVAKLKQIFDNLAPSFCEWYHKTDFKKIVYNAIESRQITTPLSIRDLIFVSRNINTIEELKEKIEHRENEIVKVFALEILVLPTSAKVLLYLVFLSGNAVHSTLAELFLRVLDELRKLGIEAKGISFNIELRNQVGYRIEKLGITRTTYKLSHPVYEEALIKLINSDSISETILKIIIQEFAGIDVNIAYEIIGKIVIKYPKIALLLIQHLLENNHKLSDDQLKVTLSQKLIPIYYLTSQIEFFNLALEFYSLEELVKDINQNNSSIKSITQKLNLVKLYRLNSPLEFNSSYAKKIDWDRLFNYVISTKTWTAGTLLNILVICEKIDFSSINKFVEKRSLVSMQRMYFFLDETDRKRFENLFKNFKFNNKLERYNLKIVEVEKRRQQKSTKLLRNIFFSEHLYYGMLFIDKGAEKAIRKPPINLLPAGITNVVGKFDAGQVVGIMNEENQLIGVGVAEYSSEDLNIIKQHSSNEFFELLGYFHSCGAVRGTFLENFYNDKAETSRWKYVSTY